MESPPTSSNHISNCEGGNNKFLHNCCIIGLPLSPPIQNPFLAHKPSLQTIVEETSHIVRGLRVSLVSKADKFVREFRLFALQNPFLTNLVSLRSEYRRFCQINCRNHQNLSFQSNHNFAAILPGDSVAGVVVANGILNFLNIYNTLLVVRLVLTWFPNSPPAIVSPLSTLCDPYLNIFRGIIPPLGGTLDLSPILAFLVLNAFTSTASALPAELPSTEVSGKTSSHDELSRLTTSQKRWMKRFDARQAKAPNDDK